MLKLTYFLKNFLYKKRQFGLLRMIAYDFEEILIKFRYLSLLSIDTLDVTRI